MHKHDEDVEECGVWCADEDGDFAARRLSFDVHPMHAPAEEVSASDIMHDRSDEGAEEEEEGTRRHYNHYNHCSARIMDHNNESDHASRIKRIYVIDP